LKANEQVNHKAESKAASGICRKKAQNTQRVDVSPFASSCAFLWLIALLHPLALLFLRAVSYPSSRPFVMIS
jgi:hypothetical protein